MLIILEGADGVGKTTFADMLSAKMPGITKILHRGPLETDVITEYVEAIQWYRPGQGVNVICDRWHWGEEVYGPKFRDGSQFTFPTWAHVEKVLMARGAVVAFMWAHPTVVKDRLDARGDDMVGVDDVEDLIARYYGVAANSHLPWFPYDNPTVNDAEDLIERATLAERTAEVLNPFTTYIGSVAPYYLILGDKRNGPPYPHDAAFTPGNMTSGKFLLDSLQYDTLREAGIANACEEDVAKLWNTLGRPRTVALGMYAHEACLEAGIKFGSVPHPQFVRRFHHSAQEEYGIVVRDALLNGKDLRAWRP